MFFLCLLYIINTVVCSLLYTTAGKEEPNNVDMCNTRRHNSKDSKHNDQTKKDKKTIMIDITLES